MEIINSPTASEIQYTKIVRGMSRKIDYMVSVGGYELATEIVLKRKYWMDKLVRHKNNIKKPVWPIL